MNWRSLDDAPRDGRRVLLRRKQRTKPPFVMILIVIGRWNKQRNAWSIDHKTNIYITDRRLAGWMDQEDLL